MGAGIDGRSGERDGDLWEGGKDGRGASVCRLLAGVGRLRLEVVEFDWMASWFGGGRTICGWVVGIPSTRFKRAHSSSCVGGGVEAKWLIGHPFVVVAVAEREKPHEAWPGWELFRGASKAFAALGGRTDSLAFSSRGASIGASGR